MVSRIKNTHLLIQTLLMTSYRVYVVGKNDTGKIENEFTKDEKRSNHIDIGTINPCENTTKLTKYVNIGSVDEYNQQVLNFILNHCKSHDTDKYTYENMSNLTKITAGDITGTVISMLKWRVCYGYIILQQSERGVRYMTYLVEKEPSGGGFGTPCHLSNEELKKWIDAIIIDHQKEQSRLLKLIEDNRPMMELFINFPAVDNLFI